MIKVTVKDRYLNVRVGEPFLNAPSYQYIVPGSVIEVDGILYPGDPFEGNSMWLKDAADNYYWSGGVSGLPSEDHPANQPDGDTTFDWWLKNKLYDIPDLWKLNDNKTMTIAILDTGINEHIDFNFDKITGFNYLDNSKNYKTDNYGHGTHLAGIMVAGGKKSFGVSPSSKLFVAKVCDDTGRPNIIAVNQALKDIYTGKSGEIDVINMSFELIATNEEEDKLKLEISALLTKLTEEKNIFIVCSSGSTQDSFDSFPSIHNSCLAVGFLTDELKRNSLSRITPTLDIMAPGTEINSSYQKKGTTKLSGTSQAAAFTSAAIALVLQKKSNAGSDITILKKALLSSAYSESYPINEYGYGIINPNNFYKQIT